MTSDPDDIAYTALVRARRHVTDHMVRITLGGITPRDEATPLPVPGPADEFFALRVPDAEPRYYTVRAWRPEDGELDVDMLLHGSGPATEWAARAEIGDRVGFTQTRGNYAPPDGSEWIGLCGDATALPAIGRILDERAREPRTPAVHVIVALDDHADRQELALRDGDRLEWVRPGDLVELTRALARTPAPGYLWFSGEAADMRAVRHTLRREVRRPNEQWMTMGYWRRDSERWRERFLAQGPEFQETLERVWTSDEDEQVQMDRAEELLAERGLL